MPEFNLGGFLWSSLKFIGPVLLLAALGWAIWRNRKSRIPEDVTESGTRRLYAEEEQRRRRGIDGEEKE